MYLSLDFIIEEIEDYFNKNKIDLEEQKSIESNEISLNVIDFSNTWNKIFSFFQLLLENNDQVGAKTRLESFSQIAKFSCQILHKLDMKNFSSHTMNMMSFFCDSFSTLLKKIINDLQYISSNQEKVLLVIIIISINF